MLSNKKTLVQIKERQKWPPSKLLNKAIKLS